ncbi:alpha/beta fold hydrolase [Nocardioides sp. Root190]|uniref:alpha/beta fold hydrolase n=1 Tax=Nocardioides sp. Root190 TaxID=1736488 RepID=UPI000A6B9403|nr:alpha/beta hydrolase [Nocardioides sp. Root190]
MGSRPTPTPRTLDPGAGLTEQHVSLPDGRRIRVVVAGTGTGPLVVLEAGMSAPAASWVHTQREISARTRTLSYDRAGYAGSDVDAHPRTLERLTDDLTAVLDALDETAPVVLVGHSWGGPILRCFADRHPDRVAGLVFVDATLAEAMDAGSARITSRSLQLMSLLARVGGRRLIEKLALPHGASPEISAADLTTIMRDYACTEAMRAGAREAAQIGAALPVMVALQEAGTPDVPTVCLQGGRVDRGMATLRPLLNRTAATLMEAAPQGRVVIVADAGHLIPQESPGVVRDAVLDVLDALDAVPE